MLVLSRKKNESIMLGGDIDGSTCGLPKIRVMVIEIKGDRVRLGIDAPRDVSVHRQEVWAKIQQEQGGEGVRCQVSGDQE
jgi:carbon storage regulator